MFVHNLLHCIEIYQRVIDGARRVSPAKPTLASLRSNEEPEIPGISRSA